MRQFSAVEAAPHPATAFGTKVALAGLITTLRLAHRQPEWNEEVKQLAWKAGRLTGLQGLDLNSPLITGAEAGCYGVSRVYELAYWAHTPSLDPLEYFELAPDGPWVNIASKGVAGAWGDVRLHKDSAGNFFGRASQVEADDYEGWALNPYPVGGRTVMCRSRPLDEWEPPKPDPMDGLLFIDPDTHPSHGRIVFGYPAQELRQLGALVQLRPLVDALLTAKAPSAAERAAAAVRAAAIARTAEICFLPEDGFCSWCQADVTFSYEPAVRRQSITGCPECGHTWCD